MSWTSSTHASSYLSINPVWIEIEVWCWCHCKENAMCIAFKWCIILQKSKMCLSLVCADGSHLYYPFDFSCHYPLAVNVCPEIILTFFPLSLHWKLLYKDMTNRLMLYSAVFCCYLMLHILFEDILTPDTSNVPSKLCTFQQIVRWAHRRKLGAHINFALIWFCT